MFCLCEENTRQLLKLDETYAYLNRSPIKWTRLKSVADATQARLKIVTVLFVILALASRLCIRENTTQVCSV
jgi:hypothetical protein